MELMDLQKTGLILSGVIYVGSILWLWRGLSGRRFWPGPSQRSALGQRHRRCARRGGDLAALLGRARPPGLSGRA